MLEIAVGVNQRIDIMVNPDKLAGLGGSSSIFDVTRGPIPSSRWVSGPSREGAGVRERMRRVEWQADRVRQLDPANVQQAMTAMLGLGRYVKGSALEESLLDLVATRASQINGCAFCIDMHFKDASARGESEQRLYMLDAWRESPFYSERERAALLWTEAVTLIADGRVPDAVYEEVRPSFSDDELVALTMAVVTINGFNRLNIALRTVPGTYQVPDHGSEQRPAARAS